MIYTKVEIKTVNASALKHISFYLYFSLIVLCVFDQFLMIMFDSLYKKM